MAEKNERESMARLGVFVVCGLVLAAAGVVALGAGRIFQRTVPLHCYFRESVQGLEQGSSISYRGVRLGRVADVRMRQAGSEAALAMGHQATIEVTCELFPEQLTQFGDVAPSVAEVEAALRREVAKGLRVRVAWKDITGQKYLALDYVDPLDPDSAPPDLGFEPHEPYIPAYTEKSLSDIQRDLATTLGNLSKIDYGAISARLELVLAQLGQKVSDFRADELSVSFRDAAKALRETAQGEEMRRGLARIDSVTSELERAGRRANEILAKPELDRGIADLAAAAKSLRDTADGLAKSVPETMTRLDATLADARTAVVDAKIPETTAALREGMTDVANAARNVGAAREDLQTALRQVGDAGRSIARLAEFLERHPDALVSGRAPTPGGGR